MSLLAEQPARAAGIRPRLRRLCQPGASRRSLLARSFLSSASSAARRLRSSSRESRLHGFASAFEASSARRGDHRRQGRGPWAWRPESPTSTRSRLSLQASFELRAGVPWRGCGGRGPLLERGGSARSISGLAQRQRRVPPGHEVCRPGQAAFACADSRQGRGVLLFPRAGLFLRSGTPGGPEGLPGGRAGRRRPPRPASLESPTCSCCGLVGGEPQPAGWPAWKCGRPCVLSRLAFSSAAAAFECVERLARRLYGLLRGPAS